LQRTVELITANLEVIEQSTRILRARQAAGQATQVEVNLSLIRELRLRSDLLSTRADYRAMQRELLELLGLASAGDQWQVEPLNMAEAVIEPPADEAELLALGLEQRLDVRAAEWSVDASAARIQLARREGWPELALGFTLERPPAARTRSVSIPGRIGNRLAQGLIDRFTGAPTGPMPSTVEPFRVMQPEIDAMVGPMIEMELPVFDQNQAQIAKAVHEFRRSIADYEARAQAAARMIRQALVRHRESYEQVRLFRESIVPEVERNLELAQQSFVAGREDLTVFLLAQEDLIATRLRILDFYRDYLVTRAELERALGGRLVPLPADAAIQPATPVTPAPAGNEVQR
jgi:outer membrane protein TolC